MKEKIKEKEEAIKLRLEERKSLKEISKILNVSTASLSSWLKDYPLTEEEIRIKKSVFTSSFNKNKIKKYTAQESKIHKLGEGRQFSIAEKGRIAEVAVLLRLLVKGWNVSTFVFDSNKADFLVEHPTSKTIKRIQVKSTKKVKYGMPVARVTCSDGRKNVRVYKENEIDFLVLYDFLTDLSYVYSYEEIRKYKTYISCKEDAEEKWDKIFGDVA